MQIDFLDKTNSLNTEYIDLLERLIRFAAKHEGVREEAEMSISFVDNKEIQQLNKDYRDIDEPTDVISFALEEKVDGELQIIGEEIPVTLGDIIISVEQAKKQAEEYGHSFIREISFLAVHGFLHLLGYDHMTEKEEKEMFSRQEEILAEFGIER